MAEPDVGTLTKLLDWVWAGVLVLGGFVYKAQNDRISAVSAEMTVQREHIAKLFDKLEEQARRSEDRHMELLTALHAGLDRKEDK